MSNIFQDTPVTYFQIPKTVIESNAMADLTGNAVRLYTLLLYRAQEESNATVAVTAQDAARVGIGKNGMAGAIESLVSAKLVKVTRTHRGHTFELLDPVTGQSLERFKDLAAVDRDLVEAYFLDRLGTREHRQTDNGLDTHCPFHGESNPKVRGLSIGFDGGGAFKCHGCDKAGGIVEFDREWSQAVDGETVSKAQAHRRIRTAYAGIARLKRRERAQQLATARAFL